jgi:hypothetical protein
MRPNGVSGAGAIAGLKVLMYRVLMRIRECELTFKIQRSGPAYLMSLGGLARAESAAEVFARLFMEGRLEMPVFQYTWCRWKGDEWEFKSGVRLLSVPALIAVASEKMMASSSRRTPRRSRGASLREFGRRVQYWRAGELCPGSTRCTGKCRSSSSGARDA